MDWEKGEESENLEDRRGLSRRTVAIGGSVGAGVLLLIAALLGLDPQKVNQFLGNPPAGGQGGGNGQVQERPATPEEQRSRKFAATILRFTEVVWEEQFRKTGKRYEPPH